MSGRYDITIDQGATYRLPITIRNSDGTPFDLSTWVPKGQIRRTHRSPQVVAEFVCTVLPDIYGEGAPGSAGKMEVVLIDEVTATIPAGETVNDPRSKYVYDIFIEQKIAEPAAESKRILEGYVYINPRVTIFT